jgi:asparagine synthase (glutamine-hydrolysing)
MWSMVDDYRGFGPWLVSGYVMDAIVGPVEKYDPVRRTSDFPVAFAFNNKSGFPFEVMKRLLRPEIFGDALQEVHEELAAEFQGLGIRDADRAYRWPLIHRMRYHTGAPLWRHCFGTWPVVPFIDQAFLETVCACPLALLTDRHLEQRLIRQRFPELARIPLDRNSFRTVTLDPRVRELVMIELREQSVALLTRLTGGRWRRKERRQYHRSYNFNGPAWRWIRRSMEPHREVAYQLFDQTTFDRLLPPPEAEWEGANSIEPAAGVKSLLGIIGWLREFSPELPRA